MAREVTAVQFDAEQAVNVLRWEGAIRVDQGTAVVQGLQKLGGCLASCAHRHACNNPACSNVSGPSEVGLVSGRSCTCSGCHVARYCGRPCQKKHCKQHKPVCKELAAAAEPAAASAGTAGSSS